MDIHERVNVLLSASGRILNQHVTGSIHMNALLSGMPECNIGLNDQLLLLGTNNKTMSSSSTTTVSGLKSATHPENVVLEDCTFHRCVQLGKFAGLMVVVLLVLLELKVVQL